VSILRLRPTVLLLLLLLLVAAFLQPLFGYNCRLAGWPSRLLNVHLASYTYQSTAAAAVDAAAATAAAAAATAVAADSLPLLNARIQVSGRRQAVERRTTSPISRPTVLSTSHRRHSNGAGTTTWQRAVSIE